MNGSVAMWIALAGLAIAAPGPIRAGGPENEMVLPTRELIGLADIIANDKAGVDWKRWRYLSFATATEENIAGRKAAARFTLAMLNGTSVQPNAYLTEITSVLWGIDTTALMWPTSVWEDYNRTEDYYSVAGSDSLRSFFLSKTGTERPILRADQFLAGAFNPTRYAAAVGVPATKEAFVRTFMGPRGAAGADKMFGVVSENLTVTLHPSKIGRFKPADKPPVWMRLLYGGESEQDDQRLHPGNMEAEHTEFIWELPSGLSGFATYDAAGRLALSVSTRLSKDKHGQSISLGASCIECHSAGVRDLAHADDPDKILLLNLDKREWNKDRLVFLASEDQKRWLAGLAAVNGLSPSANVDARRRVLDEWAAEMSALDVVRELGVPWDVPKPIRRGQFGEIVALAAAGKVNRIHLEAIRRRLVAAGQIR